MKAELKPLDGKYYGTEVEIVEGPYKGHVVTIWMSTGANGPEPSVRELERHGVTQEQWDRNEQVGNWPMETPDYCDGVAGAPIMARDALNICDSHFEGRVAYEAALGLVKVLEAIPDKTKEAK